MGSSARGRQAEANALVPLPLRDGVAPSYLWLTETRAGGMLRFLCERFPDVPMQSWAARLARLLPIADARLRELIGRGAQDDT